MALVRAKPALPYPWPHLLSQDITFNIGDQTLNANGENVFMVFMVGQAVTIDKVGFALNTVAQVPGNSLDVSIQTVDATTGNPTGTVVGSTSAETGLLTSNDETWWVTSITDLNASLSAHTVYAVVIQLNGTGDVDIGRATGYSRNFPYGGSLGSKNTYQVPVELIDDAGNPIDTDILGLWNMRLNDSQFFNSGDTTNFYGQIITPPMKCRVASMFFQIDTNATGDFNIKFYHDTSYDTTPTAIETIAIDGHQVVGTSAEPIIIPLATPREVDAGDTLRVVIESTNTNNIGLNYWTWHSSALREDTFGVGNYMCESDDGITFTDTNTQAIVNAGVIIDQLDDGAGGGGNNIIEQSGWI